MVKYRCGRLSVWLNRYLLGCQVIDKDCWKVGIVWFLQLIGVNLAWQPYYARACIEMWVGLHRINNDGAITFYCANDLNHPSTEREVKHVISQNTPREFYPMSTIWISCKTPNFSPHSNECGPCTILALAVLSQHPNPHAGALCPYLHSHLAQVCHEWMGMIILTGKVHLLPPSLEATVQSIPMCTIHYTPKSTISWAGPQPPFLTPSHSHTLSISTKKFIRRTHLSMDVKETPTTGKKNNI